MRIFTAIDISDEARQEIDAYVEYLRQKFTNLRVGWEKPEKLHLTLKFFEEVGDNELKNIEIAAEKTASQFSNFKVNLGFNGIFPNLANPRILWIGLEDGNDFLSKIKENFDAECAKFGFENENRMFKPHLTIARLRQPEKSKRLAQTHLKNEIEPIEFDVRSIEMYESTLLPTGSVYNKLKSFNF